MKLNFGLLGIALAQSGGDDYSDERHDYSYDYNVGSSHYSGFGGGQSYSFNNFGGKVGGTTAHTQAERLSCWNSNSLRDMNMDGKFSDHTADMYHHYNHQYGFENAYYMDGVHVSHALDDFGDDVDAARYIDLEDDDHSVMAVNPNKWGYQNHNRDAKYHYGHHISDADLATNENRPDSHQIASAPASFDGVIDDWRFSLRHAGCLYEAPDFFYGGTTFNKLRFLTYSHIEHDFPSATVTGTAAGVTNVHWVHVFNAHLHIETPGVYCDATNPLTITANTCINGDNVHQFAVVMANPTYEGLGFINFVATYHDNHNPTIDTEYAGHRFRSNYAASAMYDNSGFWHLADTGPLAGGDHWCFHCDTNDCATNTWMQGGRHLGLAISSFPHNELGKDFRFNIRTLHTMGDGAYRATLRASTSPNTAFSYFFYAISTITVGFPEYVGRVNDCWRFRNSGGCTSDMVHQIIVDQSSVQATSASPQNVAGDIGWGNHQMTATLTDSDGRCADNSNIMSGTYATGNNCASWCSNSGQVVNGHHSVTQQTITNHATNTNNMCGDTLTISGMLSTYDELHLRQYGTIQEIWVQLMYGFSHSTGYTSGAVNGGFESPFPNVFFSAPQVKGVMGSCSSAYGKCDGYTRAENVPFAGTDVDGARWANDVDGQGADRGDSFWPDDHNV